MLVTVQLEANVTLGESDFGLCGQQGMTSLLSLVGLGGEVSSASACER